MTQSHLNKILKVKDLIKGDILHIPPREFYIVLETNKEGYKELDIIKNCEYIHNAHFDRELYYGARKIKTAVNIIKILYGE